MGEELSSADQMVAATYGDIAELNYKRDIEQFYLSTGQLKPIDGIEEQDDEDETS